MTPIAQNVLRVIDVVQKQIERSDSLDEPALDQFPFVGRDNPRDQIEWKNPLRPLIVVVNCEGDALSKKRGSSQLALAIELSPRHFLESLQQFVVMRTDYAGPSKHFIEKFSNVVVGEKIAHEISLAARKSHANEKPV